MSGTLDHPGAPGAGTPAASPPATPASVARLLASLDADQRAVLDSLETPARIQEFLDSIPYSSDPFYRCPRRVLRERRAHCFDGALLAAAALRRLGHPPLVVDLFPEPGRDDDHVLAVWQRDRHWGAIGKSNFAGLRYREPVYASLRELVMSYFEVFYNVAGEKTLRAYTAPLDLGELDALAWMERDEGLEEVARRLDGLARVALLTPAMIAALVPLDERSYEAGMLGTDDAGLFRLE